MITLLRRLAADRSGVSAIEFALIFPLIFLLHMAAAEGFQAYVAQRNVAHLAASMADIAARSRTISTAELDDIMGASASMMYPLPNVRLQQRVSSLTADASGTVRTDWTVKKSFNSSEGPSVPGGYLKPNESVIVTDVVYDYQPTFGFFLPASITMTRHAYSRPRLSSKVEKVS